MVRNSHRCGQQIRALRQSRGWTQEQLSDISGVAARTIQRIEKGETGALDTLKALASAFKLDVSDFLEPGDSEANVSKPRVQYHPRITTGKDLVDVIGGAEAYNFDHDPLEDGTQTDLVAAFLQDLHDAGEAWAEMDLSQRLKYSVKLNSSLEELERCRLLVFGGRARHKYTYSSGDVKKSIPMQVATVFVIQDTNPEIIKGAFSEDVFTEAASKAH